MAISSTSITAETASALGKASGAARRRRSDAVRRLVAEARAAQGLPPTIDDADVLGLVADQLAATRPLPAPQ